MHRQAGAVVLPGGVDPPGDIAVETGMPGDRVFGSQPRLQLGVIWWPELPELPVSQVLHVLPVLRVSLVSHELRELQA